MLEGLARLEAALINDGRRVTFRKARVGSKIDVTFVSDVLVARTTRPLNED